ncbi:hypothetical protein GWK87_07260 [Staphylococcus schleiferi subsp. coagulans]|uniref:YIP1 family protein n=1 Tax=Staphylococcus coagulans TaxID=74706 RepID=UPI0015F787B5|nr:YIP1 family protein [Staphylococcus coagulans]MBA8760088.1 hypothetical protein [Staphylococcus coagulans]MBA8768819.1 hypothetical protein [Staphylococcus coagulans]
MNYSKLLHIESFVKERQQPKVLVKILIFTILACLMSLLTTLVIDFNDVLINQEGLSPTEAEQALSITRVASVIGTFIVSWFLLAIFFLITWGITKIFKSNVSAKVVFASSLRYSIIMASVSCVVLFIQWLFHIDPSIVSIDSLNIFAPKNKWLGAISLRNMISAWFFGIMLHSSFRISQKWSWIGALAVFILLFVISGLA